VLNFNRTKKIFIAATYQNVGKTTFSLGLTACLKKRFKNIGFIKPIGQRYLMNEGYKVDEDSVLIEKVFGIGAHVTIKDLSPIAVERGFTENYIQGLNTENYKKLITRSYNRVARDNELIIVEGTGHAGVGSVFDLSNASVAKLLKSKVILIAPGGIGRPIDEVMLNKALFDMQHVEIAGVVVNKVLPEKLNKVSKLVRAGFKRKNVPVLGVMPYQKRLDIPTVREIMEELRIPLLCGAKNLDYPVDKILVGAMEVDDALKYVTNNSLVITPSDRIDILEGVIRLQAQSGLIRKITGVILTGDMDVHPKILSQLENLEIPTLSVKKDTFNVVKLINQIIVKIKPEDKDKIRLVVDMVERYVDIDAIISNLK